MACDALYIKEKSEFAKIECFNRYCLTSLSPAGGRAACLSAAAAAADRCSAASLSGHLGQDQHSWRGVQGCLPCLCPTALLHGLHCLPCARPRPCSRGDKSKTLLDTRARPVRSAHHLHSSTIPPAGLWVLRRGSALHSEQTKPCVQKGRADKHVSL